MSDLVPGIAVLYSDPQSSFECDEVKECFTPLVSIDEINALRVGDTVWYGYQGWGLHPRRGFQKMEVVEAYPLHVGTLPPGDQKHFRFRSPQPNWCEVLVATSGMEIFKDCYCADEGRLRGLVEREPRIYLANPNHM